MKRMDEMMDSLENAFLNDIDLPEETLSKREIRRLQKKTLGKIAPKRPALRGRRVALIAAMAALLAVISVAAVAANSGTVSSWFKGSSKTDKQTEQEMELLNQIGTVWDQSQQIGDFKVTLRATYGDKEMTNIAIEIEDITGKALDDTLNFENVSIWLGNATEKPVSWENRMYWSKGIEKQVLAPNRWVLLFKEVVYPQPSGSNLDMSGQQITIQLENLVGRFYMKQQVSGISLKDLADRSSTILNKNPGYLARMMNLREEDMIAGLQQPLLPIFRGATLEYVTQTEGEVCLYVKPNGLSLLLMGENLTRETIEPQLVLQKKDGTAKSYGDTSRESYFYDRTGYLAYRFQVDGDLSEWQLIYPDQISVQLFQEGKWTFQFENTHEEESGVILPVNEKGIDQILITPLKIKFLTQPERKYLACEIYFKDGTKWDSRFHSASWETGGIQEYMEYIFDEPIQLDQVTKIVVHENQEDPGTIFTLPQ